jgi:hypothetical protein
MNTFDQETIASAAATWTPVPHYVEAFRSLIMQSSLGQVEQASVWYRDAEEVAEDVARNLDTTLEVGASIVAAFSPRERWSTNVSKAIAYSMGQRPKGLQNNLTMADNAMTMGFDALRGLKTNAFARAIAGDTDAVVIDIWMMRAAGMQTDSPNKGQYRELSEAVHIVAEEFGITPPHRPSFDLDCQEREC